MLTLFYICAAICVICSLLSYSCFNAKGGGHGAGIGNGLSGGMFMFFAFIAGIATYILGTIVAFMYVHASAGVILIALPFLFYLGVQLADKLGFIK